MCCWKQFANATLRKPITGTNMSQLLVHTPLTVLKGVGPAMAEKLAKVGLENLQDLLFHLPSRYQDRTRFTPIAALRPGQDAVVAGRVMAANIVMGTPAAASCSSVAGSCSKAARKRWPATKNHWNSIWVSEIPVFDT